MNEQSPLIPMLPGERLEAARERVGLTRADVAARLKCAESVIAALEEGRAERLAPVYRRGFAQAYARLVGLSAADSRELVNDLAEEDPVLRSVFDRPPPVQATDRWLRASTYVLASLLVGTLAWQITHEAVRLSQEDTGKLAGTTAPAEAGTAQGRAHVNASIAALESLPRQAAPRPAAGAPAWAAIGNAQRGESPLREGEHRLVLSTSADSWVEILAADGTLVEQDLVRGGTQRSYRGLAPFRITLGRTSAIELAVDGRPVPLKAGERDDVTQMVLDPDDLTVMEPATAGDG